MHNIYYQLVAVISIVAVCMACSDAPIYREGQSTPDPWSYSDSISFVLPADDTTEVYDMYMVVTYTTSYPFQNIYLKLSTQFPSSRHTESLINLDLADKSGQWKGSCRGDRCQYAVPIRQFFSFTEIGKYLIHVEQSTRTEYLIGIKSLDLELWPAKAVY